MKIKYAIAYTDNGSPPPHGKIIEWKLNNGNPWDTDEDALEACELDGWRGYVCEYPSGNRDFRNKQYSQK
jgi:hypothetical protein